MQTEICALQNSHGLVLCAISIKLILNRAILSSLNFGCRTLSLKAVIRRADNYILILETFLKMCCVMASVCMKMVCLLLIIKCLLIHRFGDKYQETRCR